MFLHSLFSSFPLRASRGAIVLAAAVALTVPLHGYAEAQESEALKSHSRGDTLVFTVDVAEDLAGRFVPTFVRPEHTQPERGSFFVTEGRIYPAGTIKGDGASFDPNGEGAIGQWVCRGTHLVSASEIPGAPLWVDTAQLYVFGEGGPQLATEGLEGSGTIARIVTGGTGKLGGYVGEQRQTFLGLNPSGGVNLRVTFILRKAVQ
jgi:hypothetical protein